MPKFARPTSYNGRQSNQQKTGAARFATEAEAAAAESSKLIISPLTLDSAVGSLLTDAFASPPPIGSGTPSTGVFTLLDATAIGSNSPAAGAFTTLESTAIGSISPSTAIFTALAADRLTLAATSSGTATLIAGTATVVNALVLASDKIIITRSALNASPDLGFLIVTIANLVSFTVDSYDNGGVALITDVSSFNYIIIS